MSARTPRRTTSWSSTISTRIILSRASLTQIRNPRSSGLKGWLIRQLSIIAGLDDDAIYSKHCTNSLLRLADRGSRAQVLPHFFHLFPRPVQRAGVVDHEIGGFDFR